MKLYISDYLSLLHLLLLKGKNSLSSNSVVGFFSITEIQPERNLRLTGIGNVCP